MDLFVALDASRIAFKVRVIALVNALMPTESESRQTCIVKRKRPRLGARTLQDSAAGGIRPR